MKKMSFLVTTLIVAVLFLTCGVSAAQQITISNVVMNPDGTGTASIVMDSAPTGLAGFKLNLAITNPSVCDNITLVTYPSGFTTWDTKGSTWPAAVYTSSVDTLSQGGFTSGYIKAMEFNGVAFPDGSTNIPLATVTLHGFSAGSTTLDGTILTLTDNYGTSYRSTTTVNDGTITVNSPPTAAFIADVTTGDAPLTVKFTDQSTGTAPLSYAWDFNGDRITDSTEKNPETTFISVGSYPVNLTVTNSAGTSILVKPNYIIVTNPNTAPVAAAQSVSMDENTAKDITLTATDADGDALTFAIVTGPAHGTLGPVSATGVVTYTPAADYTGADSFIFTANDGTVDSAPATVTITVNNVNKAPVASAQSVSMDENTAKDITLMATDADGDSLTFAVGTSPTHGTLGTVSATGVVTYTPAADYTGTDTFTFTVNDGTVDSVPATVTITVNNVNKVPVADAQSVPMDENTVKDITLVATDADGDSLTFAVVAAPAHGTLGPISAAGVVTYTPAADYVGPDSFTFKANDGNADSAPATVTITVNNVNKAPVASSQSLSINENTAKDITLVATDADGDALTFGIVSGPAHGTLGTVSAAGVVTYTPAADYVGPDSFTFRANDGAADSNTATVTISVDNVNQAPVAADQAVTMDENTAKDITLVATDADGDVLTFAVGTAPSHGTLGTISATGVVAYTPAADFVGTDSFTFRANDGTVDSAPATVTITVNNVNKVPVAADQAVTMDENTVKDITLSATDADGDALTFAVGTAPSHGTLGTISATGVVAYTPAADYVGTDSFTFRANDGAVDSAPATVTITVNNVNRAPVADALSVTMDENTAKDITLAATDADGDALIFATVGAPAHGTLGAISPAGVVTYTPAADYTGPDSFTFKANDGAADSNTATVSITVNNVNKVPVADAQSVSMDENTAKDITLTATDADGDVLTFAVIAAPAHGTLGTVSATGVVTYTPAADYVGSDSFTFKANDGTVDSAPATVTITVSNVNMAPVSADQSVTIDENTAKDITLAATDADGDSLTFAIVTGPAHGTLGTISPAGIVTYTPVTDYVGTDTFAFKANDGAVDSNTATVTITVSNVNKAPVADAQSVSTDKNTAKDITLTGSDADGDALTYVVVSAPAHGTLGAVSATGVVTYTPAADYVGTDTFTFKANDGAADSNTATVTITVSNVNKAPVAADQSVSLDENTAKDINLAATDVDGDALTFAVITGPAHGTLGTISPAGVVTYTPAADYAGSDSFTFKANDGMTDSNIATVSITVNNVNKAPVAVDDSYSTNENVVLNVAAPGVLVNDNDPDGDTITAALITGPANGVLSLNADGSFAYTPGTNYFGTDSFTYKANDGALDSATATVTITINEVVLPPVVNFIGAPRSGDSPLKVQFTDQSTNNPTSWAWDFQNDGVIDSTDQNPEFTFIIPGTYQVNLTASNAAGTAFRLKGNYITVSGEDPRIPGTDFTGDVRTGNAPLTVHFTDLSTNNPASWAWDFQNDGIIDSTSQNPTFTFTSAGTFAVNLTATNEYGSKIRLKSNFIKVSTAPSASMTVVKSASVSSLPTGGGDVTYTYLVENTGSVSLSAVTVTDDKLGIIAGPASGDANGNGALDAGETWTYSTTTTLTATTTNTATAAGSIAGAGPVSAQSNAVTVTVGAVATPEFPTMAFPVMVIISLALLVMVARKE